MLFPPPPHSEPLIDFPIALKIKTKFFPWHTWPCRLSLSSPLQLRHSPFSLCPLQSSYPGLSILPKGTMFLPEIRDFLHSFPSIWPPPYLSDVSSNITSSGMLFLTPSSVGMTFPYSPKTLRFSHNTWWHL